MRFFRPAALVAACLSAQIAAAGIPGSYKPMVIEPPSSLFERLVDLTPALKRARSEGKPILLYMGAQDCPPCRRYEAFLEEHRSELAAAYDRLILVEVRSWIRGPKLAFRAGDRKYALDDFRDVVGDTHKVFTWPYWWLLSADLRQVRQLPRGSKHYLEVEKHKALLRVDQP